MNEESLFDEAAAIEDPSERAAFLDRACGLDIELRDRIYALLLANEVSDDFLATPATRPPDATVETRNPTTDPTDPYETVVHEATDADSDVVHQQSDNSQRATIGPYRLVRKIGEGGMGAVYLAEQEHPVRREVALKLIKPGMDTHQVVRRFEAERQALAIMNHPNIAKVLDAGATDNGRPYFVMELVAGEPITTYCDRNHLTPTQRLDLFLPVCAAVQHAHQKGIIHRDIKPSNVLVATHDGKPVPKVIDFGIAKAIDQNEVERSQFTQHGAIVGTPEYMSPEQAGAGELDVDTRTDVYALGVLLYELLTGSTPLERERLRQAAYIEVLRRIREEEAPKPSTRLSGSGDRLAGISAVRGIEPSRLTKLVRGELDWIVMKSLEKDRTRRYETANGFAQDIRRYLDGDPVEAGPPSRTYKLRRFARKHRYGLATVGAFAVLLVAATVISSGLALWANRERVRAVKAEKSATAQQTRAQEREQMAIDAVKRYGDVVSNTAELRNNPGLAKLRATLLKEPQSFFKQLRDRLQADKQTTPESLARLATASFDLGHLTATIGDNEDAIRAYKEALEIRKRLASENPTVTKFQSELSASHLFIGFRQASMGQLAEAKASYEQALAIVERQVREDPSNSAFQGNLAAIHDYIGNLQAMTGRSVEVLASYKQSLAIYERLARQNPSDTGFQSNLAATHNNIGAELSRMGRAAEAMAASEQSLAIRERLARENPSDTGFQDSLAASLFNIGSGQEVAGRPTEAMTSYLRSLTIRERLASENPSVTQSQREVAACHFKIGSLELKTGQPAKAMASLEHARAIFERLVRENPTVTQFQCDLASSHLNIGTLQLNMGKPLDTIVSYDQARVIFERLASENPSVTEFQNGLASSLGNLGMAQGAARRTAEAMASYGRATVIRERLVREHPDSPAFASDLGVHLGNMARIDLGELRFDEARAKLVRAIEWQRKALAVYPKNRLYRKSLASHLSKLIRAAEALGHADEAAQTRRELAELVASDPAKEDLDALLAAVLNGSKKPTNNAERIQLADRANEKAMHAAAFRLYAEALANDPKLVDSRQMQHRYNAACAASLATSGQSKDVPPPDDADRAKLRRQALDWLTAELTAWKRVAMTIGPGNKETVAKTLAHWKADGDLASIRDEKELAKLSEEERAAFKQLWADVDALLAKVSAAR